MSDEDQTIYYIKPKSPGVSNTLQVSNENSDVLFTIGARVLSPMGRTYTVLDWEENEYMTTRQAHTVVFPKHAVLHGESTFATFGQNGVVPLKYFIDLGERPRLEITLGRYATAYVLLEPEAGTITAEVAPYRDMWIVALSNQEEPAHMMPLLAMVFRDTTVGG